MDPRDAALSLARTRMAVGLAALAVPGPGARLLFGRADTAGTRLLVRMLGGRDLALGLGVVIGLDRGAPVRGWLEAGALSDGVDFASTLLAREDLPAATAAATAGTAAAAALAGLWLSRQLYPAPPADPGQPEAAVTGHPAQP